MTRRVVSLAPSSTETLLALGADVVACTRFCEQPDLRHVGGTKNPDLGAIRDLDPDLVVLDREENRREDHDALVASGLKVFVSDVTTLTDGVAVVAQLAQVAQVETPQLETPPAAATGPRRRAVVPIWRRPWMAIGAGTYGASLLAHLGVDVVPSGPDPYPTVELDSFAGEPPDLVLVPSEPYVFSDAHVAELRAAFPDASPLRIDGQDLFWWGIRTIPAVTRLQRALEHPPTA